MIYFLDEVIEPLVESNTNLGSILTIIAAAFATIVAAISSVLIVKKKK